MLQTLAPSALHRRHHELHRASLPGGLRVLIVCVCVCKCVLVHVCSPLLITLNNAHTHIHTFSLFLPRPSFFFSALRSMVQTRSATNQRAAAVQSHTSGPALKHKSQNCTRSCGHCRHLVRTLHSRA